MKGECCRVTVLLEAVEEAARSPGTKRLSHRSPEEASLY